MKKSECFYLAQKAVVDTDKLTAPDKIEVLKVLSAAEDFEKWKEDTLKEKEREAEGKC